MVIIIHGEEIVKSRQQLDLIKKQNEKAEIITVEGKKLDMTLLKQLAESQSLIGPTRLLIVENLSENKKLDEFVEYLEKNESILNLVLWENKDAKKSFLKHFEKVQVFYFKPEIVIFKLLESLRPGNQRETLKLFEESLRTTEPEIIFYMLIRQFRLLLLVGYGVSSGIEELDRLAPWQKQRVERQAKYFSKEQLISIYHGLLEIDYGQKTGLNSFNLGRALEIFILNV